MLGKSGKWPMQLSLVRVEDSGKEDRGRWGLGLGQGRVTQNDTGFSAGGAKSHKAQTNPHPQHGSATWQQEDLRGARECAGCPFPGEAGGGTSRALFWVFRGLFSRLPTIHSRKNQVHTSTCLPKPFAPQSVEAVSSRHLPCHPLARFMFVTPQPHRVRIAQGRSCSRKFHGLCERG